MSVYYEALRTGRLAAAGVDWTPAGIPGRDGARQSCKGIRRALREAKRIEAEERNERTPISRRASVRRQLAALEAEVAKERAADAGRYRGRKGKCRG